MAPASAVSNTLFCGFPVVTCNLKPFPARVLPVAIICSYLMWHFPNTINTCPLYSGLFVVYILIFARREVLMNPFYIFMCSHQRPCNTFRQYIHVGPCCAVGQSQPVSTGRGKTTASIPQNPCFSPQCVFIKALTLQQFGCGQQMYLSLFRQLLVGVAPRWMCLSTCVQHIPVTSS